MSKTVDVELYVEERDFIIDLLQYVLLEELTEKLKNAKQEAGNIMLVVALDSYDLEQLIGNLSLEANHNKKCSIQDAAFDMAERLEVHESYVE